jgi:hypothetical protein
MYQKECISGKSVLVISKLFFKVPVGTTLYNTGECGIVFIILKFIIPNYFLSGTLLLGMFWCPLMIV